MRSFTVGVDGFRERDDPASELPAQGFVWLSFSRREFEVQQETLQSLLQRWTGGGLLDLHVSDLLSNQLPSHFDTTSSYDLLNFRRLAASPRSTSAVAPLSKAAQARELLESIDTSPVGFAVFDRVLVTVHPAACAVHDFFVLRLAEANGGANARGLTRLPTSPADLMLRMVNHMVDSYLDLRRLLTRELTGLQRELLDPKSRFQDWQVLLDSRNALHLLEDTCEDQSSAIQEWLDSLLQWPEASAADRRREHELLVVTSRDVAEHIERVLAHVRRLEQSAEVAVQMHFSAQTNRTNDIMRTLTVLTAVFMPLNLITGFFGMNFDGLPLIHSATGVWIAMAMMAVIALVLGGFFWRRRYLGSSRNR
jgi:Mg2+ and Co2+ transporter CorA